MMEMDMRSLVIVKSVDAIGDRVRMIRDLIDRMRVFTRSPIASTELVPTLI